jgi:hypothetical protein
MILLCSLQVGVRIMILCAELQMGGESHVKINGALLAILSRHER